MTFVYRNINQKYNNKTETKYHSYMDSDGKTWDAFEFCVQDCEHKFL